MPEKETLVVVSKIKDYIKSKGCMTSAETIPALSEELSKLIDKAVKRTKDNGRQTVKPQDL